MEDVLKKKRSKISKEDIFKYSLLVISLLSLSMFFGRDFLVFYFFVFLLGFVIFDFLKQHHARRRLKRKRQKYGALTRLFGRLFGGLDKRASKSKSKSKGQKVCSDAKDSDFSQRFINSLAAVSSSLAVSSALIMILSVLFFIRGNSFFFFFLIFFISVFAFFLTHHILRTYLVHDKSSRRKSKKVIDGLNTKIKKYLIVSFILTLISLCSFIFLYNIYFDTVVNRVVKEYEDELDVSRSEFLKNSLCDVNLQICKETVEDQIRIKQRLKERIGLFENQSRGMFCFGQGCLKRFFDMSYYESVFLSSSWIAEWQQKEIDYFQEVIEVGNYSEDDFSEDRFIVESWMASFEGLNDTERKIAEIVSRDFSYTEISSLVNIPYLFVGYNQVDLGSLFYDVIEISVMRTDMFMEAYRLIVRTNLYWSSRKGADRILDFYENRDVDESKVSKMIRYRIIADHLESSGLV